MLVVNLDSSTSCFTTEKQPEILSRFFLPEFSLLLHVFSCFLNKYHELVYSSLFFFFFVKLYFTEVVDRLPSIGRETTDSPSSLFLSKKKPSGVLKKKPGVAPVLSLIKL